MMDGFPETGSSNPGTSVPVMNMYDREAVPLTVPNHTANHTNHVSSAYTSPLQSPTSSVPAAVNMLAHTNNQMYNNHHGNMGNGAHTTSSSSVSGVHPQGQINGQLSTNPIAVPQANGPHQSESSSPTEGIGMLDTVDDSAINSEASSVPVGQVDQSNPKQSFVPCKVCGDKASGYHYGVTSCEGCKGFFRRSIQKQIEYRCLRDGKCLVIRLNRNRCQYCRFKKCLAVGMSRDSVRYGRVPKRSKSIDQQLPNSTTTEQQDAAEQESRQLAIYDVILTVSQAHHCNCLTTEDKAKRIIKKTATLIHMKQELGNGMTSTMEMLENHRCIMFKGVTELVTPSIQNVVEFAKRIPGFSDLSQDDQLVLIKSSYKEVWLTHIAKQLDMEQENMVFTDGSVISKSQLEIVYNPDFVESMFKYGQTFSQLGLNDTEIGLYCAIVVCSADRPGLLDSKAVEKIQDRLIEALKLQLARNHSSEPNLFPAVVMKLPELKSIGSQHNDLLDWFRHRWQRLNLPPLYAEIFDIPKSEEDLVSP